MHQSEVMSISNAHVEDLVLVIKRMKMPAQPVLSFSDEDKVGTHSPHDDALVVIVRF